MFEENKELYKGKPSGRANWRWLNIDRQTLVKLGLLACLGIVLIVVGQLVKSPAPAKYPSDLAPITTAVVDTPVLEGPFSYQQLLEQQLATTLSQIQGAGQVVVQLSLEGGNRVSYATNQQEEVRTTEEKASAETVRVSEEKRSEIQLVMAREGGSERPIVVDENLPTVRGIVVIAQGAADPTTKEELSQAVQVLLGLPAHKVKVLEREG
ncbi:MAG: hypothetical protein GX489_02995 [Firmicutes bacterium]|jgi:stage III sporulation protein AG|nr:hypothetical protein [Bacillota bacterium]